MLAISLLFCLVISNEEKKFNSQDIYFYSINDRSKKSACLSLSHKSLQGMYLLSKMLNFSIITNLE